MTDSDSSEGSDWEEVKEEDYIIPKQEEDDEGTAKEYAEQLDIPKEGIQITIEGDEAQTRRGKKKGFDIAGFIRRQVNRRKKELQEDIHKTHLLCLLSRGLCINKILKAEELFSVALSVLPSKKAYPPKNIDISYLENFIKWFKMAFKIQNSPEVDINRGYLEIQTSLVSQMKSHTAANQVYLVFIFIVILRALGVEVRLIWSLQPVPLKPTASEVVQNPKKQRQKKAPQVDSAQDSKASKTPKKTLANVKKNNNSSNGSPDKANSRPLASAKAQKSTTEPSSSKLAKSETLSTLRNRKAKNVPTVTDASDYEELSDHSEPDSDFDMNRSKPHQRKRKSATVDNVQSKKKSKKDIRKGRKMLSSSEDDGDVKDSKLDMSLKKGKMLDFVDIWAEVYLEEEEQWTSVDILSAMIMCDSKFEGTATPPMLYVLAFGSDERVKDVTRRYASRWLTGTQKRRVDHRWWHLTLKPFAGKSTRRDKEEDKSLDQQLRNLPVPTSVQEVKNHPLFAMRRHLLKFEAIYPPEPIPVGFIRNEPVFSRDAVKTLHSREVWIREAKVVRLGEVPYKIVTARPKWDKVTSTVIKDRPLELFGEWQVEDYMPPPAQDGKVPRNDYGNVELFKEKMLPKGTVHLKEPGLNRVAKKLGIDCAPALVGFEFHSGGSHPTYDGYVVCEEFKDVLLDAWREDQLESQRREEAKRKKRVRENWRRLIRMVIVRRRLERKYESFNFGSKEVKRTNPPAPTPSSSSTTSASRAATKKDKKPPAKRQKRRK